MIVLFNYFSWDIVSEKTFRQLVSSSSLKFLSSILEYIFSSVRLKFASISCCMLDVGSNHMLDVGSIWWYVNILIYFMFLFDSISVFQYLYFSLSKPSKYYFFESYLFSIALQTQCIIHNIVCTNFLDEAFKEREFEYVFEFIINQYSF